MQRYVHEKKEKKAAESCTLTQRLEGKTPVGIAGGIRQDSLLASKRARAHADEPVLL